MIPEQFFIRSKFPENSHGKVDRKALAQSLPDPEKTSGTDLFSESGIPGIWRRLLNRNSVTITDHFFQSGGDSLQMLQMVEELRQKFQIHVNIARFIERPALEAMDYWQSRERDDSNGDGLNRDQVNFSYLLGQQKTLVRTWQGVRIHPESLIMGHHVSGKRPPLFWCFQGFEEMKALSAALGNDQPLYGMRSGHLIIKPDSPYIADFAVAYSDEILRINSASPLILGGNCQGAYMALEVARVLQKRGISIARFFMMEADIPVQVNFPVSLIFGRESVLNPFQHGNNPEMSWNNRFVSYTFDFCNGPHGKFFKGHRVEELASLIKKYLPSHG
jgi:aryl carrier-like protein